MAKGLILQAKEGNTTAVMFYLKTQAGWRETSAQEEENKEAKNNPKNTIPIAAFTGFATLPDNLIRMFIPSFIIPDSVTLNFINSLL